MAHFHRLAASLVEGLDVVEMIQSSVTGRADRPVDDIEMRISVID